MCCVSGAFHWQSHFGQQWQCIAIAAQSGSDSVCDSELLTQCIVATAVLTDFASPNDITALECRPRATIYVKGCHFKGGRDSLDVLLLSVFQVVVNSPVFFPRRRCSDMYLQETGPIPQCVIPAVKSRWECTSEHCSSSLQDKHFSNSRLKHFFACLR